LELLRLQEKMGFRLAMIGDDKQCTSIEAGPIIDLARKALGPGQVPEILTTVRQQTQHERKVTALFRDGKADAALKLKRQDGSAELVPGGYREATERVASLAADRLRANAHDPTFTLTASAPTNADAHKLGLAIRAQRRAMGQVGADAVTVRAVNGAGNAYTMPIAPGDQVRLFANTRAEGMRRAIGRNGDVLTVLAADAKGMQVRNNKNGNEGRVAWTRLTDRSGRVQLAYGDVMTTHTAQGSTATEHIYALPGGSQAITGFSAYSSGTRHRRASYIILSEGAERAGVAKTRPLNDVRPITHDAIWSTVADNLGRQPTKEMATAMTERVGGLRLGSVRSWHRAAIVAEHGQQHGMSRPTAMQTAEVNRLRRLVEPMARAVDRAVNAARSTVQHVSRVLHSAAPQQQHQQQARTRTRGMSM
jgi:hypothetical protein